MDQRRAAAALFALAACFACATAAPTTSNQTALDLFEAPVEGCYYNFQHYGEGDRIMTNEPCLNCTCHNRMLMCYLRVCPFTKAIGQDCTVEKRADQCCPIVTCPDVPVDLLTSTSTSSPAEYGATGLGKMDKYGCSIDGKYFPEGSKVPPTPNKPCEHCYCIHNMTTCVMQECTLHVDGCTPIYHKDVCCPIRYSCDHPEDEIPLLDDMTTTVRPTPGFLLTTTTMMPFTQASQDCVHENKIFADGALIKTEKACEHCYCMKGDIVCVVQECGRPMENEGKNCTSLPPKQGQCCPDTYICEGDELSTTQFDEEITTMTPPRRFGDDENGYRNEPDETFTEISSIGNAEEGSGEDQLLSTISSLDSDTPSHNMYPYSTEINTVASEITTHSNIEEENTILTTLSPLIPSTITDDSKKDIDEEKELNVMTTAVPTEQHVPTTPIEDNLNQKQNNIISETSSTIASDQFTTIEPTVTTKLNEISNLGQEITTKQTLLDDIDNMTPVDEEFIIATKLPEKTDNIENSYEEPVTTFKPTHVEDSITEQVQTTPKTEQSTYSSITTSGQETTTFNVQENEILEETLPARIPGEGDCLLGGVTFKNNTSVPSTSKCHSSCKCVSSIIKCDPIICTPPLEYMENMNDCQPIYDSPDSCCPTYVCSTKETVAPESHSQMSGTETPKPIECVGDECHINQESKTTEKSVDHVCDENGCQEREQSVLPQNDCTNGKCDSKEEKVPLPDTPPCDETTGCQVPVIQPCEGENCVTKPVIPTDMQDKLDTENKLCNNEQECQVPVITPCTGDDCSIDSKLPDDKETDELDKDTKDEQNICNDENCRRKEYDETKANAQCSGTDCMQHETISPIDVNKMSSPKDEETIQTTKAEGFTPSESQSTLDTFIETTAPSVTSSEIKQILKDTVTALDEPTTTQTSLIDENLVNHQTDTHLEADKPSTESSPDISTVEEHLTSEKATTEHSFSDRETSDENKTQYTTVGIQSERTTEVADKSETVLQEDTKDTNDISTEFATIESTTASITISSHSEKEDTEDEYFHTTRPSSEEEETTHSEILEEEITTRASPLIPSDTKESSSDTTESELLYTKEITESDLSVQPIADVTKAPDSRSEYSTTERIDHPSSTSVPEEFTKDTDDTTIYSMSTEESKKEENDLSSTDLPTVTEATKVLEEATEVFNKDQTTFQPESHKHKESETTQSSTVEENQNQNSAEKDIREPFTEAVPTVTTAFDQKYSQEDHSETNPISSHKQETQTKIPETKYTEVTEDLTTAFTPISIQDKTSHSEDNERNTEATVTNAPSVEDQTNTMSSESQKPNDLPSEILDMDTETTTLRVSEVNEPSVFTTSKSIENTVVELEKTTPETLVTLGDKIHTTSSNEYNEISEETTKLSLPTSSETINELVTEITTENYKIKDHMSTEVSNEDKMDDSTTVSASVLDKTDHEQSTESSNELVDTEIVQSTELTTEPKPEILTTDGIDKDEMTLSKTTTPQDIYEEVTSGKTTLSDEKLIETSPTTSKSITTLFDKTVDVESTMTSHESTETPEKDDFGQTHGFEKENIPTTTQSDITQTETSKINESQFTKEATQTPEDENTFVGTTESTFDSDSDVGATTIFAADLEQQTKASTDSSEPQEKETLPHMSLITEKTHITTIADDLETVAVTKTKEPEPSTIEVTTAAMDSITTKQHHPISETVTPSIELITETNHSDVTTELPQEEATHKSTSQLVDESVTDALTEQSVTTVDELTTHSELTSSSGQIENQSTQELPHGVRDESTPVSTTLAGILNENELQEETTEAERGDFRPSTVMYESQSTTDININIEEKTKQPETTELMTESVTKTDQTTAEPLRLSTVHQESTMSSVDKDSPSYNEDGISTTIIVESEPETITKAPETTIQEEINNVEIDTTKHHEPEVTTETSYEIQKQPTTIKDETFVPTQTEVSFQQTTVKTISTENIQTTISEESITTSPLHTSIDSVSSTLSDSIGSEASTESVLDDKIVKQEVTTESKYEYSETTPYFVELEEHTHQIMQETTDLPVGESSTEVATGIQSTERGDQSLSDISSNEVQTEKSTESPKDYTQETTQTSQKQSSNDVYTTAMPEISTSVESQEVTEIKDSEKLDQTGEGNESTISPTQTSSIIQNEESITSMPLETKKPTLPDVESIATTEKLHGVINDEVQKPDVPLPTEIPDEYAKTTTPHDVHEDITTVKTTVSDEKLVETSPTTSKSITTKPEYQPAEDISSPDFPPSGAGEYGQEPDYGEEEQAVIPGICRYGGKVYGSTQQIPRDDPCDFCFCFRSDIICLQQSCPPPIHGCREEPIQGFCCPRYECPVSMATTLNVTTTTTTTTTTLPPHFLPHAYKGAAQRRGCHIKGHSYKVGEVVRASSGPCLHCTCGGDGQMKCDPKACTPEPMLRQMIAAAVSSRRRR